MLAKTSESERHGNNGEKTQPGWKKRISDLLEELGFINKGFKGEVNIKLNQGGVRSLNKKEEFE